MFDPEREDCPKCTDHAHWHKPGNMADEQGQFETLLQSLMSPDNDSRVQSEVRYVFYLIPGIFMYILIAVWCLVIWKLDRDQTAKTAWKTREDGQKDVAMCRYDLFSYSENTIHSCISEEFGTLFNKCLPWQDTVLALDDWKNEISTPWRMNIHNVIQS